MKIHMSWFLWSKGYTVRKHDFKKCTQIQFSNKERDGQVSAQISLLQNLEHDIWYHGMPTLADRRL